jgi:ubiquinone/menaquinone biosynthesis C-methylase UbiE
MVDLPEFVQTNSLANALRRMRSRRASRRMGGLSSESYWNGTHVDAPSAGFASVAESLSHYKWRNAMYPGCIEIMPTSGADGLNVLDYGCGPGNDLIGFGHHSKPAALHAADVSAHSLDLARARAALHGIPVTFHHINETNSKIDLPDQSIDLIHCAGVLHHLPDPALALKEWRRILKPGGRAQVMVYHKDSLWLHLHVAYDLQIRKGMYSGMTALQAFHRTTDGEGCPIANCYSAEEFQAICAPSGFACRLSGVAMSLLELRAMPRRWDALGDKRLPDEHRDFLYHLALNDRGWPICNGRVAGLNACFVLMLKAE